MTSNPLKYLTLPAISKHTATVIFIHGLGDTGNGWRPVADMLRKDPGMNHVKWILPHSHVRPVTANMGLAMPSWFDIYSFGFNAKEDQEGMLQSKNLILQVIAEEVRSGTPPHRIFLGGFSQGGTMSLLVGLTGDYKLAGLAILSSWLPLRSDFKRMAKPHASSTSVFWGYGANDALIRSELSEESVRFLETAIGIPRSSRRDQPGLFRKVYGGIGHEACPEELEDLKEFIKRHIPGNV
ncbi:hypothetical protein NP233_g10016 [Leucocoprinus birnbaumii]|uniref:Acyl-protein thioesterase 1 n=1 Tax=Leucocoprinus birnbaumii TaxID=56174 RepID=A0AAD5VJC6_9AGAR|nr:hypothetical protein NP233_g10016 [Leucocoprinus birnbaumii]